MSSSATRRPGRPPARESDDTRDRILAAARACFGAGGFAATSNRQIAARADLTPAAIYNYFPSKAALYLAAVRDAEARIVPAYREAVAAAPDARSALRALVAASAEAHARDPSLAVFLSALPVEIARHPEIADAMVEQPDDILTLIAELVDRARAEGAIAADVAPEAVVSMVVACMMGLSLSAVSIDVAGAGAAIEAFARLLGGDLFAG